MTFCLSTMCVHTSAFARTIKERNYCVFAQRTKNKRQVVCSSNSNDLFLVWKLCEIRFVRPVTAINSNTQFIFASNVGDGAFCVIANVIIIQQKYKMRRDRFGFSLLLIAIICTISITCWYGQTHDANEFDARSTKANNWNHPHNENADPVYSC